MKNTRIYLAAMAVAMLFVTSCKKETVNNLSFTARLETSSSDSKTTLDGTTLKWNYDSDTVRIYDANGSYDDFAADTLPSHDNDRTCAELIPSGSSELAGTSHYTAIYPSSICNSNASTVTLPSVQASTSGELTGYPMYAESDSKSLQFKNLCSVLKLSLTGSQTVSKIEVVTDKYINGTFNITVTDGIPTLAAARTTDHKKVTTLTLSSPVTLTSTAQYFYIYLPVQKYKYIKINIYNASEQIFTKAATITNGVTLQRSQYHLLEFSNITFVPNTLSGEFHVSPTQTVSFSKGNLLVVSGNTYKFADNQYDHKEGNNPSYTTWLYQWGSSSASTMNTPWTASDATIQNDNSNSSAWRCLTQSEWDYLLKYSTHRVSYYNKDGELQEPNTNYSYTLGTVNGVHGMLIFPDVFYWPLDEKEAVFRGSYTGHAWGDNTNSFTLAQWKILEGAGCVFLPTTGRKRPNYNSADRESTYGYYWSSTPIDYSSSAKHLTISETSSAFSDNNLSGKEYYYAIRLVKYLNN
ncbi:MAG: hypothetical protein IKG81_03570 [Bacteroidales bacterium]|nr:hypothetical protein [Bacteroidales bacterium]